MDRLFSSDLDKVTYGEEYVNQVSDFYDLVDIIVLNNKSAMLDHIEVNKTFGFIVENNIIKRIKFYENNILPQLIVEQIKEAFNETFKR